MRVKKLISNILRNIKRIVRLPLLSNKEVSYSGQTSSIKQKNSTSTSNAEISSEDKIDLLPKEMKKEIFKYLNPITVVTELMLLNKNWRQEIVKNYKDTNKYKELFDTAQKKINIIHDRLLQGYRITPKLLNVLSKQNDDVSKLFIAAYYNDLIEVRRLIKKLSPEIKNRFVRVNSKVDYFSPATVIAGQIEAEEMLDGVVRARCSEREIKRLKELKTHGVIFRQDVEILTMFSDANLINFKNEYEQIITEQNVLATAIREKKLSDIKKILKNNSASVNSINGSDLKNMNIDTLLPILKCLLENGYHPDNFWDISVSIRCTPSVGGAAPLIQYYINVNDPKAYKIVELLIQNGANLNFTTDKFCESFISSILEVTNKKILLSKCRIFKLLERHNKIRIDLDKKLNDILDKVNRAPSVNIFNPKFKIKSEIKNILKELKDFFSFSNKSIKKIIQRFLLLPIIIIGSFLGVLYYLFNYCAYKFFGINISKIPLYKRCLNKNYYIEINALIALGAKKDFKTLIDNLGVIIGIGTYLTSYKGYTFNPSKLFLYVISCYCVGHIALAVLLIAKLSMPILCIGLGLSIGMLNPVGNIVKSFVYKEKITPELDTMPTGFFEKGKNYFWNVAPVPFMIPKWVWDVCEAKGSLSQGISNNIKK